MKSVEPPLLTRLDKIENKAMMKERLKNGIKNVKGELKKGETALQNVKRELKKSETAMHKAVSTPLVAALSSPEVRDNAQQALTGAIRDADNQVVFRGVLVSAAAAPEVRKNMVGAAVEMGACILIVCAVAWVAWSWLRATF